MDPTTGTTPEVPDHQPTEDGPGVEAQEQPRVVVTGPDDALRDNVMDLLAASGFDVVDCECHEEPEGHDDALAEPDERIRPSDVLFFSFREVTEARRDACRSARRCHPKNPVVIELMNPRTFRYADLLLGARVVAAPASRESLREAVLDAWSAPDPIYETLRR